MIFAKGVLTADELLHEWLVALVVMGGLGAGDGAADDQRRASLVDEDGVHFVHDGEVMAALHLLLLAGGHAVVAQVIEAELAVRAVGDVAAVLLGADVAGLVVLDNSRR
jgi:hypothetical protein